MFRGHPCVCIYRYTSLIRCETVEFYIVLFVEKGLLSYGSLQYVCSVPMQCRKQSLLCER